MSNGNTIVITPLPIQSDGNRWRHVFELTWPYGQKKYLWWEYPISVPKPDYSDCDAAMLASVLPAMSLGLNIQANGSVSPSLIANLEEYQSAWAKWCPGRYNVIRLEAESTTSGTSTNSVAVVAFSGGLDAHFSVFSHARALLGNRTKEIKAAVMVHGLDIPLHDLNAFETASKTSEKTLGDLDVELITVSTNIREIFRINWEHHCGSGVASALVSLKSIAGCGLIASGEPYDALVTPWGSNPITDPMLGSELFKINHDGAGFNRTEKAGILSDWPLAMENLRVCWQEEGRGKNCGNCEKCVRTHLNFLVSGTAHPPCFSSSLTRGKLRRISLISQAARKEWQMIADDIKRTGNGANFLSDVYKVLRRSPVRFGRVLPLGSRRRSIVKRTIGGKISK